MEINLQKKNRNSACVLPPPFASSSSRPSRCWLLDHRKGGHRKLRVGFRLHHPRLPPGPVQTTRLPLRARKKTGNIKATAGQTSVASDSGASGSSSWPPGGPCEGRSRWKPSFLVFSPSFCFAATAAAVPRFRKGAVLSGAASTTGVLRGLPAPVERRPLAPPLLVGDSGDPGDIARTEVRLCLTGRCRRFFRMWLASGVRGCRGDWIGSVGCCSCMVHATRRIGNWNSLLFSGRSPACNSTLALANRNECLTMGYESGCASWKRCDASMPRSDTGMSAPMGGMAAERPKAQHRPRNGSRLPSLCIAGLITHRAEFDGPGAADSLQRRTTVASAAMSTAQSTWKCPSTAA